MKNNQGDDDDEEVKRGGSGGSGGGRGGGTGSTRAAAPARDLSALTVEEEVDQIMAEKKRHAQEERENAATLDKFFSNT